MPGKGLVLINYNPTANTRDRELSKANALSQAARLAHDRKRNRDRNVDICEKASPNLQSTKQSKPQTWDIQVTTQKSKRNAIKNRVSPDIKVSSSVSPEHGPTLRITVRGTAASSTKALDQEDDWQSSHGLTKKRTNGRNSIQHRSRKPKVIRWRRAVPPEFDVSSDGTHMSSAVRKRSAALPTDKLGFRTDPFSAYPIRFRESISEALDYCMSPLKPLVLG
jgi:hypothetical protein